MELLYLADDVTDFISRQSLGTQIVAVMIIIGLALK